MCLVIVAGVGVNDCCDVIVTFFNPINLTISGPVWPDLSLITKRQTPTTSHLHQQIQKHQCFHSNAILRISELSLFAFNFLIFDKNRFLSSF